MKFIFLTIFFFCMVFIVDSSAQLTGNGFAETREMARNEAFADLASQISIDIRSTSKTNISEITGKGFNEEYSREIIAKSNLPILGATTEYQKKSKGFECTAVLKPTSLKLYEDYLQNVINEANALKQSTDLTDLFQLYTLSENFLSYKVVYSFLGGKSVEFPMTQSEIYSKIQLKLTDINSFDEFETLFSSTFKLTQPVYVFPPEVQNSQEITPFASAIKDRLKAIVTSAETRNSVSLSITGSYVILENALDLTLRLTDKENNTLKSATFRFNPNAYEGIRIKPETMNLQSLIQQGVLLTNELRPEIQTDKGKTDLLYNEGESATLFLKLNKNGFVYVVGHIQNDRGTFSYLVPIGNGEGKREFIYFINADDANKWISLGSFTIVPPFGTETLQIFASTDDPIDSLPTYYTNDDGYAVLGTNPNEVVVKTRGLMRKNKKKTAEVAEATITITTMKMTK